VQNDSLRNLSLMCNTVFHQYIMLRFKCSHHSRKGEIHKCLHRRKSHHSMNSKRLYITISQAIWTRWPTCGFASLPTPPMCPLPQSCVSAEKSAAKDSLNSKSGSKCSLKRKRRQGHRMCSTPLPSFSK